MNLQTELERVREYLTDTDKKPTSEANTCHWIIWPLLLACGYAPYEIHAQGHDAGGNIPDYTILPNTPHTWFLEAKTWQSNLTDAHVIQATGYPHAQGKRWVVLSNGREWRLYDNYNVQVPPPNRLVTIAHLECNTELEAFLEALSKKSVQSSGLEKFALQTALNKTLQQELAAPTSDVVQAIVNTLKTKRGLSGITPDAVVSYFQMRENDAVIIDPQKDDFTLAALLASGNAMQSRKPSLLTFPDSTNKPVSNWRDLAVYIVEWLFVHEKYPLLPFRGQNGGKRCFINTAPQHPSGAKMENKKLDGGGQSFYVSVHRSAPEFMRCLITLCEEVGEAPEGFRVTLQ